MDFRTQVPIPKAKAPISYESKIMAMGSCFAENMAEKFDYFKFYHHVNPFGIIFNPVSLSQLFRRIAENRLFTTSDIFFHNQRWQCYELHSDLNHSSQEALLILLNDRLQTARQNLIQATHVLLTYGTAWVYRLRDTAAVVANCHKVPQNQFEKFLLDEAAISAAISNTLGTIRQINPNCNFIFTVSPVRHLRDGFVENNVSKGRLLAALYGVCQDKSIEGAHYFPSYEMLMDELRDYRFYGDDMLHPSQSAIDYIWERFADSQLEESIFPLMEEVSAIQKSLRHRPLREDSENHALFLEKLDQKIKDLTRRMPQIQF